MKRIVITILLISLVATKEFTDINTKMKNVIQNRKDGNKLRKLNPAAIGSLIVEKGIDIIIGYLVSKMIDAMVDTLKESKNTLNKSIKVSNFKKLYKDSGKGLWYSYIENNYVVSMYYHETKVHTATCDGGLFGGGEISSLGEPGEWAIAYCRAGISGRKTYYNHF
jgi:hypothetical protein